MGGGGMSTRREGEPARLRAPWVRWVREAFRLGVGSKGRGGEEEDKVVAEGGGGVEVEEGAGEEDEEEDGDEDEEEEDEATEAAAVSRDGCGCCGSSLEVSVVDEIADAGGGESGLADISASMRPRPPGFLSLLALLGSDMPCGPEGLVSPPKWELLLDLDRLGSVGIGPGCGEDHGSADADEEDGGEVKGVWWWSCEWLRWDDCIAPTGGRCCWARSMARVEKVKGEAGWFSDDDDPPGRASSVDGEFGFEYGMASRREV